MKSFIEKAQIGKQIDRETKYTYSFTTEDIEGMDGAAIDTLMTVYYAGFNAGISCAINRGYNKTNDPRRAAEKEVLK